MEQPYSVEAADESALPREQSGVFDSLDRLTCQLGSHGVSS
jgi:hypothetical protein